MMFELEKLLAQVHSLGQTAYRLGLGEQIDTKPAILPQFSL